MHRKVPVRFGPGPPGKGPAPQAPRRRPTGVITCWKASGWRCSWCPRRRPGTPRGGRRPLAGRDVAGPADPVGDAPARLRPAGRDPAGAGLHPGPDRSGRRADPVPAAAGEAAGRRPVKITSVASDGLKAKSAVAMVAALIAGERDPHTIADLARGPLRGKRDALAEALDGMSGSHHGVIAQALLDQVAFLDQRIAQMEAGAIAALAQVEESWGVDATGETGPGRGTGPDSRVLAAVYRLAEIPGVSVWLAIVIIAEIGLNMALFPTPAHLVSWMGLCRSAAQSGTRHGKGKPKKGNSYARAAAGQAAIGAARTATFLGERYARIARRRGKAIAQAAVARSIMIIVWHLLNDPAARYHDLGPDFYAGRINRDKKIRNHLRGLQALGVTIAITGDEQAA